MRYAEENMRRRNEGRRVRRLLVRSAGERWGE
jgi:hypothetical protein